ncbi:hypothetical protein KVG96_11720 [Pseudomonas sp. COR58]|uniref:Uncharacterized protein n=1 Tax=Pseudomonas ekonensis TaxID=2842353 RepID=A0ABS6PDS5_9PSED|nr:hypothetical protein [Pseudomonas ekonensis]MBV4458622.1 hypothetical protein [Pseudomonas ekonensis]
MPSPRQHTQTRACREFALQQNQRLIRQAHALNAEAFALIANVRTNVDTFEQYHLLRNKAEEKFQEAKEHLRLVNETFAEPAAPADRPRPLSAGKPRQAIAHEPVLRLTGR